MTTASVLITDNTAISRDTAAHTPANIHVRGQRNEDTIPIVLIRVRTKAPNLRTAAHKTANITANTRHTARACKPVRPKTDVTAIPIQTPADKPMSADKILTSFSPKRQITTPTAIITAKTAVNICGFPARNTLVGSPMPPNMLSPIFHAISIIFSPYHFLPPAASSQRVFMI